VAPLLELESGSNDPAAVFLTVGVIGLIESSGPGAAGLTLLFVAQMVGGVVAGLLMARGAVLLVNWLRLEYDGLYPVLTFAFVLVVYEGVTWAGGSGFLAVYVAGVTMANTEFLHRRSLMRFHDAIAWLVQIAMFVVLGLLVFPSELISVSWRALALAALLMLVARPVAVFVTMLPFRWPWRETAFVSWVGLRGATPIILATFPVVSEVDNADVIFNVVFFIVLTSVAVQGSTIPWVAHRLGVEDTDPAVQPLTFEAVISGDTEHNLHELLVREGSPAADKSLLDLGLPAGVLVVLLRRGDATVMPQGGTLLRVGDRVLVLAEDRLFEQARTYFEVAEP
jgi:cell volume regulation protein A